MKIAGRRSTKPPKLGRPAGADADATRTLILEGALEAFAASGFDGVSVRELTRRLGVSHNLVHHYFGSKDNLWREAIDRGIADQLAWMLEGMTDLGESDDPFEAVSVALQLFVRVVAQLPAFPLILAQESAIGGERLDYIYERAIVPAVKIGTRHLARLEDAGGAKFDMRSLALILSAGASGRVTLSSIARKLGEPDPLGDEAVEKYADTLSRLVLNGLRGAPVAP